MLREMVDEDPNSRFHVVAQTNRLDEGIRRMQGGEADVVLLDLSLVDSRGVETFAKAHAEVPDLPIIVLSGEDDEEIALETVHRGAAEYLVKGRIDQQIRVF